MYPNIQPASAHGRWDQSQKNVVGRRNSLMNSVRFRFWHAGHVVSRSWRNDLYIVIHQLEIRILPKNPQTSHLRWFQPVATIKQHLNTSNKSNNIKWGACPEDSRGFYFLRHLEQSHPTGKGFANKVIQALLINHCNHEVSHFQILFLFELPVVNLHLYISCQS